MSRQAKGVSSFHHSVELRGKEQVRKIQKGLGNEGVLFFYYMWEVLAAAPGFCMKMNGVTAENLSLDFEIDKNEIKRYFKFCIDKEIFQVNGDCLRCELMEQSALSGIITKREKDAQRIKQYRAGKSTKKEKTTKKTNKQDEPRHKLQDWIDKNAKRVNKMNTPLTFEQCTKLKEEFEPELLIDVLQAMDNYNPLMKNRNANLTIRNWINRRLKGDESQAKTGEAALHDDAEVTLKN